MRFSVDNKQVFELNETKKKVIQNDIPSEIFREDMERRVAYIIEHKYEKCMERLKKEWDQKLRSRVSSIPTDLDDLAKLIFSQNDYKNRSQRELEAKELDNKRIKGN